MKNAVRKEKRRKWATGYVCLIIAAVLFLTYDLPVAVHPSYSADDGLMYEWAKSIVQGQWLGAYDRFTLTKGPAFSLFLAFCNMVHMLYTIAMMTVYLLGVLIFSASVKQMMDSQKIFVVMFTVLAFNPVAYGADILQRVYRCGFSLGISLMVIGFYIFLFFFSPQEEWSKKVLLCVLCSVVIIFFPLMLYSREDSIWIIPFMLVAGLCIVIRIWIISRDIKNTIVLGVLCFLPFLSAFGLKTYISYQNYIHYGLNCVTDSKDTYFSRCISLMYSIKSGSEWQRVYITRESLDRMRDVSPALTHLDSLDHTIAINRSRSRIPEHGEIEGTWFYWSLRAAVEQSGYYESAEKSEDFYKKLYEELLSAVEDGKLETTWPMPSIFTMPWKKGTGITLVLQSPKTIKYMVGFSDIKIYGSNIPSSSSEPIDKVVENIKFYNITNYMNLQQNNNDYAISIIDKKADIINLVISMYKKWNPFIFVLAVISGLILTLKIPDELAQGNSQKSKQALVVLGLVLSFILIVFGVSYVEITDYCTIHYMYLSQGYSLLLGSEIILISIGISDLRSQYRKR